MTATISQYPEPGKLPTGTSQALLFSKRNSLKSDYILGLALLVVVFLLLKLTGAVSVGLGLLTEQPKLRIVVSGFTAFAGREVNSSFLIAQAIERQHPEWDVHVVEVPVIWGKPGELLSQVNAERWDFWIAFGEGGQGEFAIETKAQNKRGDGRDNEGRSPPEPFIRAGGPANLTWMADADRIAATLSSHGFVTRVSTRAGGYLCEEMLYNLLSASEEVPSRNVIFVHVPPFKTAFKSTRQGAILPFDDAAIERFADLAAPELIRFLQSNDGGKSSPQTVE